MADIKEKIPSLPFLRHKYIGKVFDPEKFEDGDDCNDLDIGNGWVDFVFYWDDCDTEYGVSPTFGEYMDHVQISYDESTMCITGIEPLEASKLRSVTEKYTNYDNCRATMKHYLRLDEYLSLTVEDE